MQGDEAMKLEDHIACMSRINAWVHAVNQTYGLMKQDDYERMLKDAQDMNKAMQDEYDRLMLEIETCKAQWAMSHPTTASPGDTKDPDCSEQEECYTPGGPSDEVVEVWRHRIVAPKPGEEVQAAEEVRK